MNRYFAFTLATLVALPALAQAPKPTAAQILDKNVAASGGAAWLKVQSYVAQGTISVVAQSIKGTVKVQTQAPNKIAIAQNVEGAGNSLMGFDGTKGWSKDTALGLRDLSGPELGALKAQAALSLRPASWRSVYTSTTLVGTVKVNGAPAYRVKLTPKVGSPETQYFDVKTGLQVRADQVSETPQGKIPTESYPSDYRMVNGVKIPFKTRLLANNVEIIMQFTDVKINASVDDSAFAKPKE
jgi:outer membrane lipoprotein-sorting protein